MNNEKLHRIDVTGRSWDEVIIDCAKAVLARLEQYQAETEQSIHLRVERYYKLKAKDLLEASSVMKNNLSETRKALAVISVIMDELAPESLTFCQHPDTKQLGYWYGAEHWDRKSAPLLGFNIGMVADSELEQENEEKK